MVNLFQILPILLFVLVVRMHLLVGNGFAYPDPVIHIITELLIVPLLSNNVNPTV